MRTRTFLLFFFFQSGLVGLGAWAQISGGAVWLLVVLVMLSLTAGVRLLVQAELEHVAKPLEDELKALKAIPKAPSMVAPLQAMATLGADSDQVLVQRIAQLEAELRLLCPPGVRQNVSVEPPVLAGVSKTE